MVKIGFPVIYQYSRASGALELIIIAWLILILLEQIVESLLKVQMWYVIFEPIPAGIWNPFVKACININVSGRNSGLTMIRPRFECGLCYCMYDFEQIMHLWCSSRSSVAKWVSHLASLTHKFVSIIEWNNNFWECLEKLRSTLHMEISISSTFKYKGIVWRVFSLQLVFMVLIFLFGFINGKYKL